MYLLLSSLNVEPSIFKYLSVCSDLGEQISLDNSLESIGRVLIGQLCRQSFNYERKPSQKDYSLLRYSFN